MRREIEDVWRPGHCGPGHDKYPEDTYRSNRSKRARSEGIKKEHRHARRVKRHSLQSDIKALPDA